MLLNIKHLHIILLIFMSLSYKPLMGQSIKQLLQHFKHMHPPEKWWVVKHPFVAKKAWLLTQQARTAADSMKHDPRLDGDENGGRVDAFRHAYWMALLAKEIGHKKAYSLGVAHEKGNQIDFEKKLLEEGSLPDSIAGEMDRRNNLAGLKVAAENPEVSTKELKELICEAILNGRMWIIKKDHTGNFLNWEDQPILPKQYLGKWKNPKVLVPSDFKLNYNGDK